MGLSLAERQRLWRERHRDVSRKHLCQLKRQCGQGQTGTGSKAFQQPATADNQHRRESSVRQQNDTNSVDTLGLTNPFKFEHPCSILAAGPSGAGKTTFVSRVLLAPIPMFEPRIQQVVVFYAEWQSDYVEWRNSVRIPIDFIEGIPTEEYYETLDNTTRRLLIIDDQMQKAAADKTISKLFTRGSHHRNLSIFLLVQNVFEKGLRTISLNSNYMVLFKSPRDTSQIGVLARQLYSAKPAILQDAFDDATAQAHQYLLVDLKQSTPDWFRLKSRIFPGEILVAYIPQNLIGQAPVYKP
jgi:hypothetical protein